jgi:hypothetical protein
MLAAAIRHRSLDRHDLVDQYLTPMTDDATTSRWKWQDLRSTQTMLRVHGGANLGLHRFAVPHTLAFTFFRVGPAACATSSRDQTIFLIPAQRCMLRSQLERTITISDSLPS